MIWLTWRHSRLESLIDGAALALLVGLLLASSFLLDFEPGTYPLPGRRT